MLKYLFLTISAAAFASPNHQAASSLEMLPMLAVFIALFYFMIIRPQNKQKTEHTTMLKNLKQGNEVSTSGGIIGKIISIDGNIIKLAISKDTIISINEINISKVLPKGSFK